MIALVIAATAHDGDIALEAIHEGLIHELAEAACNEGDATACYFANESVAHPTQVAALLVEVIHDSQTACAGDPQREDCDFLRQMDRQAEEVLAQHGKHPT